MADIRHPHLRLPRLEFTAPRRRRPGGGRTRPRDDPKGHGQRLEQELGAVRGELVSRRDDRALGIDPRLVFVIELAEHGILDDQAAAELGLHVLAADGRRHIVVFPDDAEVERFRTRVTSYTQTNGDRYKPTALIESVRTLTPADRTGLRLVGEPLGAEEQAAVDVELWHSGDQAQMVAIVEQIRAALENSGDVLDQYVGTSICLLRVRLGAQGLNLLLELDHVKEVDRRGVPSFDLIDLTGVAMGDLDAGELPQDAPGIVVVDTGIARGHPILDPSVGETRTYVTGDTLGLPSHGHGTWVAGIAAFGDLAGHLANRRFVATVRVHSAKVTTNEDLYDPEQLMETQLRRIVTELLHDAPDVRVINISLGDKRVPYSDGSLQFRLAATVDELAYEFRDREMIFVISMGNADPPGDGEGALTGYPAYLESDAYRLLDPATSLLGISVGGLNSGEGAQLPLRVDTVDRGVGVEGWPSAFTRTGPGHAGSIKPEFVEWAGDARFAMGRLMPEPGRSGVPTTSHQFAPPTGELWKTVAGTSFAAPRVAHSAARIFGAFPEASSNLVRALLADSARIPLDRPPSLLTLPEHHERIMNIYGYGRPDLDQALESDASRVLLVTDDIIPLDHVYLYEVPELPEEFMSARGRGRISVSLAYDPPSRHTRSREYLGIRMQFALYRNAPATDVYDAIRAWSGTEREDLEGDLPGLTALSGVKLEPGAHTRNRGTLQRGVEVVWNARWHYDGSPLVLAVTCQRRWAPELPDRQRFAVVVSVRHENPTVDLYAHLSARAQVFQQVRVRVPA